MTPLEIGLESVVLMQNIKVQQEKILTKGDDSNRYRVTGSSSDWMSISRMGVLILGNTHLFNVVSYKT